MMPFLAMAKLPNMRHLLPVCDAWQVRLEIAVPERGCGRRAGMGGGGVAMIESCSFACKRCLMHVILHFFKFFCCILAIESSAMTYKVAVTGASGMVATELICRLLAKGYSVRATVRNKNDTEKVQHLINLGNALPGKFSPKN
jgi:hypothetical protein